MSAQISLRLATQDDLATILSFIKGLAEYEKLSDQVVADEEKLRETLFGRKAYAEVVIAEYQQQAAGFDG